MMSDYEFRRVLAAVNTAQARARGVRARDRRMFEDARRFATLRAYHRRTAEVAARMAFDRRTIGLLQEAQRRVRIWEEWEALEADERAALDVLAPRGWLISPSLVAGAPRQFRAAIEEHGVEALEQRLEEIFDAERCRAILDTLSDRPAFAAWQQKFERAMDAYEREEEDSAVALLLIAIEGIVNVELSIRDVFTSIRAKRTERQVQDGLGRRHPSVDGLVAVLRAFGRSDATGPNPALRRHTILHGGDPDFGSRRDVIQCVLTLETLHMFLNLRDGAHLS